MKGWSPVGGGTKLGGWEDGGNVGDNREGAGRSNRRRGQRGRVQRPNLWHQVTPSASFPQLPYLVSHLIHRVCRAEDPTMSLLLKKRLAWVKEMGGGLWPNRSGPGSPFLRQSLPALLLLCSGLQSTAPILLHTHTVCVLHLPQLTTPRVQHPRCNHLLPHCSPVEQTPHAVCEYVCVWVHSRNYFFVLICPLRGFSAKKGYVHDNVMLVSGGRCTSTYRAIPPPPPPSPIERPV